MKPRVYVETSVISYLAAWPSRDLVVAAHQQITQEWWGKRDRFDLYASPLVVSEAARGDANAAQRRLALLQDIPSVEMNAAVNVLGRQLVQQLALPPNALDDAFHVAAATVHGLGFLVTWNCTHIANLQTRRKIESICRACGFEPCVIGTPEELSFVLEN